MSGGSIGGLVGGIAGSFIGQPQLGALAGSAIGGSLGGGNPSQGAPATGTSVNSLPSWLANPYQNNVSQATSLAQTPYNPAMNYQVAGFNPQQTQAFQGISDIQGQYQAPYNQAIGNTGQLANQATQGLNNSQFQSYMNPYIQNVLNTSNQQAYQNYGIAQNQLNEQAAGSGAFGNSRTGLAQGQLASNFMMNLGAQQAGILNQGFNTAMQGYQTGINQGLAGSAQLGNLATGQQTTGLQGLQALQASGQTQQQLAQQQLTAGQQNALQQAQYPWQQLTNLQSVMAPAASAYGINSSTQTLQQPSAMTQGLALGQSLSGLNLSNMLSQPFTQQGALNQAGVTQDTAGNYLSADQALIAPTYDSSTSTEFMNYRQGGAVNSHNAPGAPSYWHDMSRDLPHLGYNREGLKGYKKGGLVNPAHLSHGQRTAGLLHKPSKTHIAKTKTASPEALQGLQALAQQFGQQPGPMGSTPSQGLANPSMPGMVAPGAAQPQIGLMIGGQVPHSINGYAHGGMVKEHQNFGASAGGCYSHGGLVGYDNGGSIATVPQTMTTPGSLYNVGNLIDDARAQNFVNQMLGTNPEALPAGYARGGVVGYDNGGVPTNGQGSLWSDYIYPAMQDFGTAEHYYLNQASPNLENTLSQHPILGPAAVGAAIIPAALAAGAMGPEAAPAIAGAGSLAAAYPGVATSLAGVGSLAAMNAMSNPSAPAPEQPAAVQNKIANMKAQALQQSAAAKQAGITKDDIAYAQNIQDLANGQPSQTVNAQPQYDNALGMPQSLQSMAGTAAMMSPYAGHGNFAADMAGYGGGIVNQAMQQRQIDAMAGYRQAMASAAQQRAGADVQRAGYQGQDLQYKIQLQQAQAAAERTRAMGGTPAEQAQNWAKAMAPLEPALLSMTPEQQIAQMMKFNQMVGQPQQQQQGSGMGSMPGLGGMTLDQLKALKSQYGQ
jgi:hypothetical protein